MVKEHSNSEKGNSQYPLHELLFSNKGARCSSVVKAFPHGAMGRRIDPSWWTH